MEMTYDPLVDDLTWLETRRSFPILYHEAQYTLTPTISIEEFEQIFIRRLRKSGLKVKDYREHIFFINEKFFLWITQKPLDEVRVSMRLFLYEQKIARVGYVLRLKHYPEWGRVEISRKHLTKYAPK